MNEHHTNDCYDWNGKKHSSFSYSFFTEGMVSGGSTGLKKQSKVSQHIRPPLQWVRGQQKDFGWPKVKRTASNQSVLKFLAHMRQDHQEKQKEIK